MKIAGIETLRTQEFANLLWVRVYTDAEVTGVWVCVSETLGSRFPSKDMLDRKLPSFLAIFPLAGLLAASFILPEIYGFEHD